MKYKKGQTVYVNNKPVTYLAEIDASESAVLVDLTTEEEHCQETVIVQNRKIRLTHVDLGKEFEEKERELQEKLRDMERGSRQTVNDLEKKIVEIQKRLKNLEPLELLLDLIDGKDLWAVVSYWSQPRLVKVSELNHNENDYSKTKKLNAFVVNRDKKTLEWVIEVNRWSDGSGTNERAHLFADYELAKEHLIKIMLKNLKDSSSHYHNVDEAEVSRHGISNPEILAQIEKQRKEKEARRLKEIQDAENKLMALKQAN